MTIRKAIFPIAGFGTRFLPATKALPKEMLPIVDRPLIHYAVQEAIAAGIEQLIFVTNDWNQATLEYFRRNFELESKLALQGKVALQEEMQHLLPDHVEVKSVRQSEALGLGHAVLCAIDLVGDEPFAVLLPDDLIRSQQPCLRQLITVFEQTGESVIAVEKIDRRESSRYGMIACEPSDTRAYSVTALVEKPEPEAAPSDLAIIGRYLLTPEIFEHLRYQRAGSGNEIQLTDAISALLKTQGVTAYAFEGTRFDCGNKLGWLRANVAYSLWDPSVREGMRDYLDTICLV